MSSPLFEESIYHAMEFPFKCQMKKFLATVFEILSQNTKTQHKQSPKATTHDSKAWTQYSCGLSNIFIHECSLECLLYHIQPIGPNIRKAAKSSCTQKMFGYSISDTQKHRPRAIIPMNIFVADLRRQFSRPEI